MVRNKRRRYRHLAKLYRPTAQTAAGEDARKKTGAGDAETAAAAASEQLAPAAGPGGLSVAEWRFVKRDLRRTLILFTLFLVLVGLITAGRNLPAVEELTAALARATGF